MSLVRIKATITNDNNTESYFLQTFDANVEDDKLQDPSKIPEGVVVKLTWTKIPDDARLIQEKHGQDFINRLPKANNRKYTLSAV